MNETNEESEWAYGTGPRLAVLYDNVYPFVPGGGQKRLFEICRRLVNKGWQVDWYGLKSWETTGYVNVDGIRIIPVALAVPLYNESGKRSISQTLYYGRAIAKQPGLGSYDLVHMGQWPYFHFFPTWVYLGFSSLKLSVDWWEVWGRHWLNYYGVKGLLGMLLERICARIPGQLVAISEIGARQLAGIGVAPSRIQIIPNGIDWRRIQVAQPDEHAFDLVYLGRLQPHKNVDCLLRALPILNELRGRAITLTIIGDGPQRAALETLACDLGVRAYVRFLGTVASDDEVYRLIKAAIVFVHPSTKEGGGSITSLEANAAGLPVVAFQHQAGLSPEMIEDGLNGYWVAQFGPRTLAIGISRALDLAVRPENRDQCIQFSRNFDWSNVAQQYHVMLKSRLK